MALKCSKDISAERILEDRFLLANLYQITPCMHRISYARENVGHLTKWQDFNQVLSQKHFLSNHDIHIIWKSFLDGQFRRHEDDALFASILVQHEPFDTILIYKSKDLSKEQHPTLATDSFLIVVQMEFHMKHCRKEFAKNIFALLAPTALILIALS